VSIRASARLRALALVLLLIVATVVAITVPLPRPEQIREWAQGLGPSLPAVFLICHALITVAPIPRTVFTLAAGLLFGPLTGISVALVASTISAVLALLLVRKLGRDAVAGRLRHGALQAVDTRLAQRGWLAVASLRLIPVVPFSVLNYCCGVSAVRLRPYVLATIVGIAPGTVAVVLLGDAITGRTSPVLLAVSAAGACLGLVGLVVDARTGVKPDA
jgi:uncharacterized membrane protein YdjX (TVP38/TMEM64 family)